MVEQDIHTQPNKGLTKENLDQLPIRASYNNMSRVNNFFHDIFLTDEIASCNL